MLTARQLAMKLLELPDVDAPIVVYDGKWNRHLDEITTEQGGLPVGAPILEFSGQFDPQNPRSDDGPSLVVREPQQMHEPDIDMTEVVMRLHSMGYGAKVECSGGNVATIYAGVPGEVDVLAGPGLWPQCEASFADRFQVGPADAEDVGVVVNGPFWEDDTNEAIARIIAAEVDQTIGRARRLAGE